MVESPIPSETAAPVEEASVLSPRTRYRLLSLFWIFPTAGAIWILWTSPTESDSLAERLRAIPLEGWAAVALLLVHAFFICNALFAKASPPRRDGKPLQSGS